MGAALSERRMWLSPDSQHRVAPRGGSGIEYAGFRVYVVEGITQWAKHPAPGVAGSPSALNRGSAADLLL